MPEEATSTETPEPKVSEPKTVEIKKTGSTSILTFKKSKFFTYSVILALIFSVALVGVYFLGVDAGKSANQATLKSKEDTSKNETKKEEGIVEGKLGKEVKVKNGISIKLEEAVVDQTYENEKEQQRKYYEKATYSAYLESDYFKTSNLKLRVSLTNSTEVAVPYNLGDFRLKDSEDVQYVYSTGEQKQIYNLNPGETTKILLNYYVPSDEDQFTLVFDNASISFKLD